eukprot:Phypoly_transcript_06597.p1 GENE.Phypoly_transcript_06597~~Phypoly_transcript_06597.p1  ORF type:complete len:463 (+),score=86.09 Phypoly_transcript_06597:158-1546(+)
MMAEKKSISEERRVRELEDIICTLKFELNGLKDVVTSVEINARIDRETMKQGFEQRVQHVIAWLARMKGEVDIKANEITQLEAKVKILEERAKAAKQEKESVSAQTQTIDNNIQTTQQEKGGNPLQTKQENRGTNLQKEGNRTSLNLGSGANLQLCTCHHNTPDPQAQKVRIEALEGQLQAEKREREKAELAYADLLEKFKEIKPKKEKKPPANLGVPHKLVLPEAPAPKFWLQTLNTGATTDVFSLTEILEGILRPFREDEIWALLHQAATLLHAMHENGKIHGNLSLDAIGSTRDGKISLIKLDAEAAPKFKPHRPSVEIDAFYDIFGLGVMLWSTSDYLLEDDEEPATSEELCMLIGDMTSDELSEVPPLTDLIMKSATHAQVSQNLFRDILREVDRKKELRKTYVKGIVMNQDDLVRNLLNEIATGIVLKKVPPPEARPHFKNDSVWQSGRVKSARVA